MTEEARKCVGALRKATYKDTGYSCNVCPVYLSCPSGTVEFDGVCAIHKAADLIESLSAQLDQVTRERDAAVEDLKYVGKIDGTFCEICKHQPEEDCEKRKFENMDCFEWRGVGV